MRDEAEELYRFGCPACGQMLKAAQRLAGRGGMCPACEADIVFPQMRLAAESWTLRQVMEVVSVENRRVEEETLDRVGLLLAQGTCLDYTMGREQLPERMAARQWRRLGVLAASRELIRLDILWKMEGGEVEEIFKDHASAAAGRAWMVMARYLHFNRHGMCKECKADRTGMGCIYQSFERFLEAAGWDEERAGKWQMAFEQVLGLPVAARREKWGTGLK